MTNKKIQLLNPNIREDDAQARRFSQLEIDGAEGGAPGRPTVEQFGAYQAMYDYFNTVLFEGKLPPVILNFSRRARTYGFFAPKRWDNGADARTHEISLNPSYLKTRPGREVAATLVHEMAHLWQQEYGTPSRTGYHNTEWARKMEALGLQPSDTGQPGGRRVGQNMTHYVIDGGPFDRAFGQMPALCFLPWQCQPEDAPVPVAPGPEGPEGDPPEPPPAPTPTKNKTKYTCPTCAANIWGKPGLVLACLGNSSDPHEPAVLQRARS